MTTLRHILRTAGFCGCAALVALAAPRSAPAAEDPPVERRAAYDISLGGITFASATFSLQSNTSNYGAVFEMESDGLLDWFYEATIKTGSDGAKTEDGRFAPKMFTFRSFFDKKPQDVDVAYSEEGPKEVRAEPPFKPRPWEIAPEEQTGALDPISAAVSLTLPETSDSTVCSRKVDIYDGRRRYEIAMTKEVARIERDGGIRVECEALWTRLAGFKPKYMKDPSYPFKIRYQIGSDGVVWPIRAWADTDYGAVIAVLDD